MAGGGHPPKRSHTRPTHTQNTRTSPHPKPHPNPKPNTKLSQNKRKIAHGSRVPDQQRRRRGKETSTNPTPQQNPLRGGNLCVQGVLERAFVELHADADAPTRQHGKCGASLSPRRGSRNSEGGGTAGGNHGIFSRAVGVTGGEMREEKRTEEHSVPRPRYLERIDKSLEAMRDSGPRSDVRPRVRRTCYARA